MRFLEKLVVVYFFWATPYSWCTTRREDVTKMAPAPARRRHSDGGSAAAHNSICTEVHISYSKFDEGAERPLSGARGVPGSETRSKRKKINNS